MHTEWKPEFRLSRDIQILTSRFKSMQHEINGINKDTAGGIKDTIKLHHGGIADLYSEVEALEQNV